jgi:hypothetical protein
MKNLLALLLCLFLVACSTTAQTRGEKSNAAESAADNPDAYPGTQSKKAERAARKATKKAAAATMPRKCKNCTIVNAPTTNVAETGGTGNSSPTITAENGSRDKVKTRTITRKITKTITKTAPPWWMWPLIIVLALGNAVQLLRRFVPLPFF